MNRRNVLVCLVMFTSHIAICLLASGSAEAAQGTAQDDVSGADREIEAILERVEAQGERVKNIVCRVEFTTLDRIDDDQIQRTGELLFKRQVPNPWFMIAFDKTVQEGVVRNEKHWYTFDGRWLLEASERSRSIIRRDIAPSGTEVDLFSIDKAPFPIPFGQRKDDILRHFEVKRGAGDPGVPEVDHLICTPKADSHLAKVYSRLEFYVSRAIDLPTRIVMTSRDKTRVTTANFPDLSAGSINIGLDDRRFRLPAQTKDYAVADE